MVSGYRLLSLFEEVLEPLKGYYRYIEQGSQQIAMFRDFTLVRRYEKSTDTIYWVIGGNHDKRSADFIPESDLFTEEVDILDFIETSCVVNGWSMPWHKDVYDGIIVDYRLVNLMVEAGVL